MLAPWKKSYDQPRQRIKKQRHYFGDKGQSSQSYSFSSGHVWMWELDYRESWAVKNWCFWSVMLETLESPLDCKEIQPVNPKEISPECPLEGLMLKLKLQYFGHLMQRADSFEKTLIHLKRPWFWERLRAGGERDDRGWDGWMASSTRWTCFWWPLAVGDGQGGLACGGSWGRKESDMTERLNWTELYGRKVREGADMGVPTDDFCWCMTENQKIL